VFARPTTFVKAELAIDPIMSGRDPLPAADTEFGPGDWAGVAVQTATLGFGEPAKWVFAEWVVPEVSAVDPAGYDQIAVGFWVGLDGFASFGQQVLQAGIAAYVDPGLWSTDVNWYAWTEWYTDIHKDPAVNVANFPVAPGDTVSFLVCAPQPDLGHITMLNRTRGHLTSFDINAPSPAVSQVRRTTSSTSLPVALWTSPARVQGLTDLRSLGPSSRFQISFWSSGRVGAYRPSSSPAFTAQRLKAARPSLASTVEPCAG
jgi:hypothetical protein